MMSKSVITVHTLYNFLWYLTHALISVVQLIHRHLYLKFKTKRVLSYDLRELANGLQKIPKHIAVCVNEHHVDCDQLIQLIRWCHVFNVKYVSLFSHYGVYYLMSGQKSTFLFSFVAIYVIVVSYVVITRLVSYLTLQIHSCL